MGKFDAYHDGMCGVSIGDGPCSCAVGWFEAVLRRIASKARERGDEALWFGEVAEAALDGCDCDCHEFAIPCIDCKPAHGQAPAGR